MAVRKLLIVMSQLFLSKYIAFQAAVLIILMMFALVFHALVLPYAVVSLNILETVSLMASIIVMQRYII